jgi:hypothetical protein
VQYVFPSAPRRGVQRMVVVAACTLGLGCGCATGKPPARTVANQAVSLANTGDIKCTSERVTGSLVATRVCTSKSQRDEIREHTQDARDTLNNQVIAACPGTPGCK